MVLSVPMRLSVFVLHLIMQVLSLLLHYFNFISILFDFILFLSLSYFDMI